VWIVTTIRIIVDTVGLNVVQEETVNGEFVVTRG
jgi:hypothetical protein